MQVQPNLPTHTTNTLSQGCVRARGRQVPRGMRGSWNEAWAEKQDIVSLPAGSRFPATPSIRDIDAGFLILDEKNNCAVWTTWSGKVRTCVYLLSLSGAGDVVGSQGGFS